MKQTTGTGTKPQHVMPKSISYVLQADPGHRHHTLPVTTLGLYSKGRDPGSANGPLVSAGRDGAVVLYDQQLNIQNRAQLHTDWVNDVCMLSRETVVSCSADLSVKLWRVGADPVLLGHHADYVKALALMPGAETANASQHVASAGLDRTVKFWDTARRESIGSFVNELEDSLHQHLQNRGAKGSIYALAANDTLLALGDNAARVVLVDPRCSEQERAPTVLPQVHSDTIKSLLISKSSNSTLLSGSSDGSVRLWDLRMNACLKTYTFGNPVWALHSTSDDLSSFYTGDSKGFIYTTGDNNNDNTNEGNDDASTDKKQVVWKYDNGILALCSFNNQLLASTTNTSSIFNVHNDSLSIKGESGIIRSRLLNNRRSVLTLDTADEIRLWDILTCKELPLDSSSPAGSHSQSFDEAIAKHQTNEILPNWCRVSVKAGKLFVTISQSSFQNTEVYGDVLNEKYGLSLDPESRYNLGRIMIKSLLGKFLDYELAKDAELRRSLDEENKISNTTGAVDDELTESNFKKLNLFSKKPKASVVANEDTPDPQEPKETKESQEPKEPDASTEPQDTILAILNETKASYTSASTTTAPLKSLLTPSPNTETPIIQLPDDVLFIVNDKYSTSSIEIDLYIEFLAKLSFQQLEIHLPEWIGNFLLKNKVVIKEPLKIGFILQRHPDEQESLPNILNSNARLNANNMLRAGKILTFITDRLENKTLEMEQNTPPEEWLEIIVNDQVIPHTMTLATLKATIWKSNGDIPIFYKRKHP